MSKASRLAALLLALAAASAGQSPDLPPGPMQAKARTACLECHDAHIILQQRLDRSAWRKEIEKMVRWGALVEPADVDPLTDYFFKNFNPSVPPLAPGAPQKGGKSGRGKISVSGGQLRSRETRSAIRRPRGRKGWALIWPWNSDAQRPGIWVWHFGQAPSDVRW